MLKNQHSIELNTHNSRYDEVFIRADKDATVLAGTLVSFTDEGYELGHSGYHQKKYNEGFATTDYTIPETTTTDVKEVLYAGTIHERVKHTTVTTTEDVEYTASYDVAQFYPAVIIENSLISKSLNHQNYANRFARCRRLVAGDKFLLRAVAGSYAPGDLLYAVQTDNGIYVTKEEGGMFIGRAEETYTITDDMVDLVDTYRWPLTTGSLRGALVNLLAVRICKLSEIEFTKAIPDLVITQTENSLIYDGEEHEVDDFFSFTGLKDDDVVEYEIVGFAFGDVPVVKDAGTYQIKVTVFRRFYAVTEVTFTFVVNKKTLEVTGSTVADKEYDGTTAAAVTVGTVSGFIGEDSFAITATGVFEDAEAGEDKNVVVTYAVPEEYPNYAPPAPETLTADITPKFTYTLSANGSPGGEGANIVTTTELYITFVGSGMPESIPLTSIEIDGDVQINTTDPIPVVDGVATVPVIVVNDSGMYVDENGDPCDWGVAAVTLNAGNTDTDTKITTIYFVNIYWGNYPCQLGGASAPTLEQIFQMEDLHTMQASFIPPEGASTSEFVFAFALNETNWDTEVALNGITGDDADFELSGCGHSFFLISFVGPIDVFDADNVSVIANFDILSMEINGTPYRLFVTTTCETPDPTRPYTVVHSPSV